MIKKCLLLIPVTIIPYVIILMGYLFFGHPEIIENVFNGNVLFYFVTIFAMLVFSIIVTCITIGVSIYANWDCVSFARSVMIVKLIHIPAYIIIFLCGVAFSITIFLYAANILLVIFDCCFIAMTGGLAVSSVILAIRQKKWKVSNVVWPILLQFIFCVDVIASIIFYIKLKSKYNNN